MKLSSDTLFHFTSSRKNLEGILENRFKLSYCKEEFALGVDSKKRLYVPMITFCDMPLSLTKDHITKYGSYAIGVSKDWAITNKINPVLYIERNSNLARRMAIESSNYKEIIAELTKVIKLPLSKQHAPHLISIANTLNEHVLTFSEIIRYIKNYESDLVRGGKTYKKYRFYDEREWRFVPDIKDEKVKYLLNQKEYDEYRKGKSHKPLIDGLTVDFKANDIKYIIVKSSKDIPLLIKKLMSIENLYAHANEKDILITKILTVEQLNTDF